MRTIRFLNTLKDAPKMLELIDKTFYQMPFLIQPLILFSQDIRSLMWWYHYHDADAPRQQIGDKILCSVSTICNQAVKIEPLKQAPRRVLSWRYSTVKCRRKRLPKPSTVTWILQLKPPRPRHRTCSPLFFCAICVGISTNDGAIDQPIFHIEVVGKIRQHSFPHACFTPAHKAFNWHCSSFQVRQVVSAVALHFCSSTLSFPQNDGTHLRFPHTHSGYRRESPELSSIRHMKLAYPLISNANRT